MIRTFFTSKHPAVFILRWALAFVIVTSAICVIFEEQFIFHPARGGPYDADPGYPVQDCTVVTGDGLKLHGLYAPVEGARGTILWFHGNGGNVAHCFDGIADLRQTGASVFIVDYRGYGKSEGSPSAEGMLRDAEAAYAYVTRELKIPPERLVVFGKSLGGAAAIYLASKAPCAGLVVQSTFTSIRDMAPVRLPYLPWVWPLARTNLPNLQTIAAVRVPKLFIHSRDDDSIPFWMGEKLFEAAPEPKEFLAVSGFGHNDPGLRKAPEYQSRLRAFVSRICK